MCSPMLAIQAVGVGMTAFGQMRKASANARASEQQAGVREENRRRNLLRADDARNRGRIQVQNHKLSVSRVLGDVRAGFSSGGVTLEGSPTDVLADTAFLGAHDEQIIRTNAEREAWEFEVAADNDAEAAGLLRDRAGYQRTSGIFNAIGTIAGGVGRIGGDFMGRPSLAGVR